MKYPIRFLFYEVGLLEDQSADQASQWIQHYDEWNYFAKHLYLSDEGPFAGEGDSWDGKYARFYIFAYFDRPMNFRDVLTNLLFSTATNLIVKWDNTGSDEYPAFYLWNPYDDLQTPVDTITTSMIVTENGVPRISVSLPSEDERRSLMTVEFYDARTFRGMNKPDLDKENLKYNFYYDVRSVQYGWGKKDVVFRSYWLGNEISAKFCARWWAYWRHTLKEYVELELGAYGFAFEAGDLVTLDITAGNLTLSGTYLVLDVEEIGDARVRMRLRNIPSDLYSTVFE